MSDFSMDGFHSDPWAAYDSPLSESYVEWVPEVVAEPSPSFTQSPPYVTAQNIAAEVNPVASSGWEMPSFNGDKIIRNIAGFTDWGLKVSGQIFAANNAAKDQQLNNYMKKAQVDIFRQQADSASTVAAIGAKTQSNLAMMRANAANTGAVGANLGAAVGNNSLMLWLTVAGLALAFIQVVNSSK